MAKIVIVGAGGVSFTKNIVRDLLLNDMEQYCDFTFMDIHAGRLQQAAEVLQHIAHDLHKTFKFELTTDLRQALRGAAYVITVFRCGTPEHQKLEYEIPARYGVLQCVGDSMNPGGIFRGLRTLKALFEVVDTMEEVCPGAKLFNYVNPMSMNTIALSRRARTVQVFGLCHSVQGTIHQLATYLNIPFEKFRFLAAGVNHQAFFLKLEAEGRNLYPELFDCLQKPEIYHNDKVRFEILRHFGYFPTESSGHGSEYLPYFRKRPELLKKFCSFTGSIHPEDHIHWYRIAAGEPGAALEVCQLQQEENAKKIRDYLAGTGSFDLNQGHEYAPSIISCIEKNEVMQANLNVINHGLIPTLPPESSVEVPCLITGSGIYPCRVEHFPEELAALNRNLINAQLLGAQGALRRSRRDIFHAIACDPLTAAVLSLDEIKAMTDDLFAALGDQIEAGFTD